MITNYYTLLALVEEWQDRLPGRKLIDAFSQEPAELTLAFASEDDASMLRIGTRAPFHFIFRSDGYSKARRNVATLFDAGFDRTVDELSIAHRDRMIFLRLQGGLSIQIMLFGPRANVLLLSENGTIKEAFRNDDELAGEEPPSPRAAPSADTLEAFKDRWKPNRKSVAHALSSAMPLFDRDIAAEVAHRAAADPDSPPDVDEALLIRLYHAAVDVQADMVNPSPRIYWDGEDPLLLSLIELQHLAAHQDEPFEAADDAVRIFVRRSLARRRFRELYDPVHKALSEAAEHYRTSADRMLDELSKESRADQYEKWGHLLMAVPQNVPTGAEEVELEDLFSEDRGTIQIPLDPAKSAVANARDYYDRARRTRRSREEAEKRLLDTEQTAEQAAGLLDELEEVKGLRDVQDFRKTHEDELARFMPDEEAPGDRIPFRRFSLDGGYEVWVGRNARQNDDLTFHHAQKYDLWMHARGVPGSHAVLRKPNRDAEPGKQIIHSAASIAAHFSKARGSRLVPVMVTERKYVTKPKGAPPGAVRVEREDVVLVEPRLPP